MENGTALECLLLTEIFQHIRILFALKDTEVLYGHSTLFQQLLALILQQV